MLVLHRMIGKQQHSGPSTSLRSQSAWGTARGGAMLDAFGRELGAREPGVKCAWRRGWSYRAPNHSCLRCTTCPPSLHGSITAARVTVSHIRCRRAERRHLVVVLGGDRFNASSWMTDPEHATWDLYLIYYGSNPAKSCPLCTKVRGSSRIARV